VKILYTNFHHRNGGGHVTYIINLLNQLKDAHQLCVATPATSRLYRYASRIAGVQAVDMRYTSRLIPMLEEVWRLRKFLQKERFDLVHVNASADHRHIMLACAGLSPRPRIIWTKHNDHSVSSVGHRIRARFATDRIIAVSTYVHKILAGSAYRNVPIHVIHHGVDTDYFAPVPPAEKHRLRCELFGSALEHVIVLGSSGGTDYDKGWLDLVSALAQLPVAQRSRFRIVVAGDLPDQVKVDKVRALGLEEQVLFAGLSDDVRPILAACDIGFVLSYREALSYACRESLALGLPTLISNAGGLPENLLDGVEGWIVPARDPAAIAAVLRNLCDDIQRLRTMGIAARRKSEREFNLTLFRRRTLAVYEQALAIIDR